MRCLYLKASGKAQLQTEIDESRRRIDMAKKNGKKNSEAIIKPDLAVHETIELHEILTVKQSSYLKANMMLDMADDKELKKIIRKDIKNSKKAIEEIQELLP